MASENDRIEWQKLGKAALIAAPVVAAFYGYWYLRNYLSLKKLANYAHEDGVKRNLSITAQAADGKARPMQFRVVDVDGYDILN